MPSRTRYGQRLNCNVPEKFRAAIEKEAEIKNATLSEVTRDILLEGMRAKGMA